MLATMPRPSSSVLLAASLLTACTVTDEPLPEAGSSSTGDPVTTADSSGGSAASSESTGEAPVDGPTFYQDILPIIAEQCQGCHVADGIGAFDLTDYEVARLIAPSLAAETDARRMPPFVADNTGACNTFADARWLTDEQIELFARWAETGAQQGDPATPRPEPPAPEVLLGDDILSLTSPDGYLPLADDSGGADDYQCFLADLGITDAPRYLTGYEVIAGNPAVTHHLVAFLVDPAAPAPLGGTNGALMASLDAASPDAPGWDCYGAAGNGVLVEGTPVTWAPGGGATNFPAGTGIRLDPGYQLVLQMHYNLVAGDDAGPTELRLSMADEVEREAVNALDDRFLATLFNGTAIEIPPGEESFVWKWQSPIRDWDSRIGEWEQVELLGLLPHMHGLGRRMQVTIHQGDTEQCGIYVDRWDFNWQQAFMYETPIVLSPSDQLEVVCDWDTSGKDTPTTPGLGTNNEMCLLGIYAAQAE